MSGPTPRDELLAAAALIRKSEIVAIEVDFPATGRELWPVGWEPFAEWFEYEAKRANRRHPSDTHPSLAAARALIDAVADHTPVSPAVKS